MKELKYKLLVDGEEIGKINSPDSLRTLQKSFNTGNMSFVPATLLSIYYRLVDKKIMILTTTGKQGKEESALFWFNNHLEFMDSEQLEQASEIVSNPTDEEIQKLTGYTFDQLVANM
ncbi:MAG: hypothetical protein ACTSX1_15730 [Candidatus Heimdallarchaeaceae archaeon]